MRKYFTKKQLIFTFVGSIFSFMAIQAIREGDVSEVVAWATLFIINAVIQALHA